MTQYCISHDDIIIQSVASTTDNHAAVLLRLSIGLSPYMYIPHRTLQV